MKKDQVNKILINIVTVAIGLGVVVFGYFSFVNKGNVVTDSVAVVANIAVQTTTIGADIDNTVRTLNDLSRAVALSAVIFDLPAFKSLQNFSVPIPSEKEGRDNPFTPAEWKLKMNALEASSKDTATSVSTPPAPAPEISLKPKAEAQNDLFGDFASGL